MSTKFEIYHYNGENPSELTDEVVIQEQLFDDDLTAKIHYYPKNTICIETDRSVAVDYHSLPDTFNRFVGSRDDFYEFFRTLLPQIETFKVITQSGNTSDIVGDNFKRQMNAEQYPIHTVKLNVNGTNVFYRDAEFVSKDIDILNTMMQKFGEIVGY